MKRRPGFLAYTKKIISAGPLVKEVIYPRIDRRDGEKVRAQKRKATSEARQRINDKFSWQKCEMKMAANFLPGDPVVCLTYNDAHLPQKREQVRRHVEQFIREARQLLPKKKRAGFRLLYSIENKHGDGRWHVHLVCNAPCDKARIQACWRRGETFTEPLLFNKEKNYATLAKYFCKEEREKPGQRAWSCTRTCVNPEVETFAVPNDTQLSAPRGADVIEQSKERTEYGRFEYIKYAYPEGVRRRKFTRRPRRR